MADINSLVQQYYGFDIKYQRKLTVGAGSNTYLIDTDNGKFILKNSNINEANNPQNEPKLCKYLLQKGMPVSEFIKTNNGLYVLEHEGNVYHMQKYVDGINPDWNTAPAWLLNESAQILGRIHTTLTEYESLPIGIGENFFRFMKPETALESYKKTLQHAKEMGDFEIENDLLYRIDLMKRFIIPTINLEKLTCSNTHGDFFISQLICGERKINAVIDWTTACIHPVVWEIMRSFVYASPDCGNGTINISEFINYVEQYLLNAELNPYDIKMLPYVFYYQISVCDYYNQYYQSVADNRNIYMQQAILSTKMMKWFDKHIDELNESLVQRFSHIH